MHRNKMAQIIVINSINSASGKTLFAAHLAVMLAKDYKTVVMDDLKNTSPLADFIARRYTLNLSGAYSFPIPQYQTLTKENLEQGEQNFDVIILDSPDSKYYPKADIMLTILSGQEGLNAAREKNSLFSSLIWEAKKKRAADGKSAFRWVILPNDDFTPTEMGEVIKNGRFLGFNVAPKLERRKEYVQALVSGITVVDKDLPALKSLFDLPDLYARRNLKKITDFIWQNK